MWKYTTIQGSYCAMNSVCLVFCRQIQNFTAKVGYNHCPAHMLATPPGRKKETPPEIKPTNQKTHIRTQTEVKKTTHTQLKNN